MGKREYIDSRQLRELLKKYAIGKKPLSALLGWGETTVLLYCNMENIPQNEYSERLYNLYINKEEYLGLLLRNRDKITPVAFRKSLAALHRPILENRILTMAQYVFDNTRGRITQAQLEVILMWTQILCLKFLDKTAFDDIYQPSKGNGNSPYKQLAEAMNNSVFFSFSEAHGKEEMKSNIKDVAACDTERIIEKDICEIIDYVTEMFSWYGESAFNSLLAAERFRLCGPSQSRIRRSVSNDMLKKIYSEVFEQAKVKKLTDVDGFISKRIDALRKKKIR